MNEELMPLEEIEIAEKSWICPQELQNKLCETAHAAHRLQEEVERLKVENAEFKHNMERYQTVGFSLVTENEELRKDAERLDYLLSSSNLVVRCDIPSNEGWRVLSPPNNYLTGWHETERDAKCARPRASRATRRAKSEKLLFVKGRSVVYFFLAGQA